MITHTGHAEIDQQHAILEGMLRQLETLCGTIDSFTNKDCQGREAAERQQCTKALIELVQEIGNFLIGHATYEERMMELLPDTPVCQNHIRAHKSAHEVISRRLKKLLAEISSADPQRSSQDIWEIIGDWLGDHTDVYDQRLVRLQKNSLPEIDYDEQLVSMLDQHVFPNRPKARTTQAEHEALKKQQLAIRGCYETLSPAQCKVFWLVVAGRKNREIAAELRISMNTVKSHRSAIFQKMEVSSVLELIKKTDHLRPL